MIFYNRNILITIVYSRKKCGIKLQNIQATALLKLGNMYIVMG